MRSTVNLRINNFLVLVYLLLISNAVIAPLIFREQNFADDSASLKLIKYLPIILFFVFNRRIFVSKNIADKTDKILALIVGVCFLSVVWSPAKLPVLGNSIQFAIFFYFIYFLKHSSSVEFNKVFRLYLSVIIIFSFLFIFLLPSYGRMSGFHDGLARGVFFHKNILGSTLILFLPLILTYSGHILIKLLSLFALVYLIVLSGSSTSLVAMLLVIILSFVTSKLKRTGLIIMIFFVAFCGLYIYFNLSGAVFNALGKSEDLTGRLILWENILTAIQSRPLLGFGYWGFWNSSMKAHFFYDMDWITGKSHNAFLDLMLSGGYVLLLLGVALLVRLFSDYSNFTEDRKRSYAVLTIFAVLILSMTEIGLIEHNNINLLVLYLIPRTNV